MYINQQIAHLLYDIMVTVQANCPFMSENGQGVGWTVKKIKGVFMRRSRKENKTKQGRKEDDGMQPVLDNNHVALKIQLLKARANKVQRDNSLRHLPNEHDIQECSDNTQLLYHYQEKTIRKEE